MIFFLHVKESSHGQKSSQRTGPERKKRKKKSWGGRVTKEIKIEKECIKRENS